MDNEKHVAALQQIRDVLGQTNNSPVRCAALDAAIAALSQPVGGAPVWMVRDRATGKIWIDEVCVWSDEMSARECAEDMNENIDDANFEAVAMLAAAPTPHGGEDVLPDYIDAALRKVRARAEQPRSAVHGPQFIAGLRCAANMIEEAGRRAAIAASREVGYER